ncbi:hypothetical protein [Pseudomonas sp. NA-150]|uniref:hypothetical protein n=1 Tax=Pseudomonas sp. NA-150 TaxID=3367525 RepID=UPI0037C5819B
MGGSNSGGHATDIVGLHHISTVVTSLEQTLRFYLGTLDLNLLGLPVMRDGRPVMRFYCGDRGLAHSSVLCFIVDERLVRGARGSGQISAVTFSVPLGSLRYWQRRFEQQNVEVYGRAWAFDKEHLCFSDPDGMQLALVEDSDENPRDARRPGSPDYAIRGIRTVEIQVDSLPQTTEFLVETMGFTHVGSEGAVSRFSHTGMSKLIAIDILSAPGRSCAGASPGFIHDVVWRVPDERSLKHITSSVSASGLHQTDERHQDEFTAVYFRDPGGINFAVAFDDSRDAVTDPD